MSGLLTCGDPRGRRPPISGLPEIGIIMRKSATADLRGLASLALRVTVNQTQWA
jgi:hypothetical protein